MAPTVSHLFALLDHVCDNPGLVSDFSPLDHLFHNPAFPLGLDIGAFKWWTDKGLYGIGHFYTHRGPLTLSHCTANLQMPPSSSAKPPSLMANEQGCTKDQGSRGGISMAYASLLTSPLKHPYMLAWERDLDFTLKLETWYFRLQVSYKGILSVSLIEAGIKVLTRWYLVTTRLARMYPSTSADCFRHVPYGAPCSTSGGSVPRSEVIGLGYFP